MSDVKSVSANALLMAIPSAIMMAAVTMLLFYNQSSMESIFWIVLCISLPVFAFIIATLMNLSSQYMTCRTITIGHAMSGAFSSVVAVLAGIGIASLSLCRIPIASIVYAFVSTPLPDSKDTCCRSSTLEVLEGNEAVDPDAIQQGHLVKGASYSYYVFFSMLFGMVLGSGDAVVC